MIQGTIDGNVTFIRICRSLAPMMRKMFLSSASTPLTPAKVLKKVRKNTTLMTSITLDVGPMPNQMMNSGASAMRGMPLKATT